MKSGIFRTLSWLAAFLPGLAQAQNLVPNGSFETYQTCPRHDNLLEEAPPWVNPNRATPDFYHQCFPLAQLVVPPRTGQGLARLFLDQGWAEYLQVPLTSPLQAGECYYFELFLSVESPGKFFTQSIGAHVSEQPPRASGQALFNVVPQVLDNLIPNAIRPYEWQRVAGYVSPKGGERFLTIGSFNKLPGFLGFHYLFVDDVSLQRVRVELGRDTTLCGRQSTHLLRADATGATDFRWQDGSTASTFLVTKPGKYWVTVSTPCRTVSDTVNVAYALDFDLGTDTTLCEGQTLKLNTPADARTVRWQDGSTQSAYPVREAGMYRVRVQGPGCTVEDSLRVRYIRPPQLELGPDRALCVGESFTLNPSVAEGAFAWEDPFPDQTRTVRRTGTFRASVRNECATVRDSVRVQQGICGCILHVPDVFTPNADGLNETFGPVAGCAEITLTSMAVFNRWGEMLFQTNTPPFEWDGRSRGLSCPEAAYAWEIGYQLTEGGVVRTERKQGALRLTR